MQPCMDYVEKTSPGFLHTMSITNHNYAQHIECIERYVTSAQDVSTLLRQGVSICSGLDIVLRD